MCVWGGDAREHSGGGGGGGPPVASTPDTAAMWLGSWPMRLREPLAQVPTFFPQFSGKGHVAVGPG